MGYHFQKKSIPILFLKKEATLWCLHSLSIEYFLHGPLKDWLIFHIQ
jgi:hypothetical protein